LPANEGSAGMNFAFKTTEQADFTSEGALRPSGPAARIEILDNLADAEVPWRWLFEQGGFATPYQHYDFCALWFEHVGAPAGNKPLIVIGYDAAGLPIYLWPLVTSKSGPCRIATFFCGRHANFGTNLWRSDVVQGVTAADLRVILDRLREAGVDTLLLQRQPRQWRGIANPLMLLPHQASPDESFSLNLNDSSKDIATHRFNSDTRRKLRRKERQLASLPGYRYRRASLPAEVDGYFDEFMKQKAARLSARGIRNAFSEPGVEAFMRAACHKGLAEGRPLTEIHVLDGGGEMLALFAGIHDGRYFSTMFNSYTLGSEARYSPGIALLLKLVADCASRGFSVFNLGVGAAEYKSWLCDVTELQFDSFLGLTTRGRLFAIAACASFALKGRIKRSPKLLGLAQNLRQKLAARRHAATRDA
jgi:CelD/BcsL family acetyltransferase involved in cellulose biosynthesis